jgi:exosortase
MIHNRYRLLLIPLVLGTLLLWAYWFTLAAIVDKWSTSPQYSHGYLVPLFAVVYLWLRRSQIASDTFCPSSWGLVPLAVGAAMHIAGAYFYVEYLEALSLLPCLVGFSLCCGGKRALYWSLPSIAFLFFMLPLPFTVELMLGGPLRRIATLASTYTLQTLGFPAVAEGNIIMMESQPIAVAEACSGLSMLLTFFALSTGFAMVIKRWWGDKIVLVLSALPIAIIANVVRIVATAVVSETVGTKAANVFFHDFAGLLMMPLALGMLAAEMALMAKLFVERTKDNQTSLAFDGLFPLPVSAAIAVRTPVPSGKPKKNWRRESRHR